MGCVGEGGRLVQDLTAAVVGEAGVGTGCGVMGEGAAEVSVADPEERGGEEEEEEGG